MRFEYTAVRRVTSGHTSGNGYEIVIYGHVIDMTLEDVGPRNYSIDGTQQKELWRIEERWRVTTDYIAEGTAGDEFEEFLASVMGGESFVFDPESDTAATAVNPKTVKMRTRSFKRSRPSPGRFQYTFEMEVVP